jgi:hypothetical protein
VIISNKYKLIFISTPKSGSHTGFKLMQDYFEAENTSFNHNTVIPNNIRNYHSFTFVRNPYDRFCALYHACVINHFKPFVPKSAKTSPLTYAKWYAKLTKAGRYPRVDLCAAQWVWHKKSRVKEYIHIEEAQEVFNNKYSEKNIIMPHELKRNHIIWNEIKTDELIYYVNLWAGKDFQLYGYKNENDSC